MGRSDETQQLHADVELDIFGQQSGLNLYTQLSLCYLTPGPVPHEEITATVQRGLEKLTESFPWIAGHLTNFNDADGTRGPYRIAALNQHPVMIVKGIDEKLEIPSMEKLEEANFPIGMLQETVIAARNTIAGTYSEQPYPTKDVFLVQINFIEGGMILTFNSHHQVMDLMGQVEMMRLLSKACRGEPYTATELQTGNPVRKNIMPLLDHPPSPEEFAHQIKQPRPASTTSIEPATSTSQLTWASFSFSADSLAALKADTAKDVPDGYVSTDDALCALIWQSTTRARAAELGMTSKTTYARAVDTRRYMGLPAAYPGLCQNMAYSNSTVGELLSRSLGSIANEMRSKIDPKTSNMAYNVRALATLLANAEDINDINMVATLNGSSDIMQSSWAKADCYDLDFGLGLGQPRSVRRPHLIPFKSLMYFLPKRPDGEISVILCLPEDDVARLKADVEFTKYGKPY